MKNILFLTTEIPFPLDNGGRIRTYNLLKAMENDFRVDLVCFSEKKDNELSINELKKICFDVKVVHKIFTNSSSKITLMKNMLKGLFSEKPFIVSKFIDNKYRTIVKDMTESVKYDYIIADHLNICGYLDQLDLSKVILSEHNCEYLILERRYLEEKNFLKKLYIKNEYIKTEKYEKNICKKVAKTIMLTEEDKSKLIDESYKGENVEIIPICIEDLYVKKQYSKEIKNILFLGTMSWYPNEQGIRWFLDNVWTDMKKTYEDLNLYIVGKNPSESILKQSSDSVIVTGYVDDVNEYIEKCDLCVVPLFIGGGMRVKILECMSKGIPVISTSIGAEGIKYTDNNEIVIANTCDEFIESVGKLKDYEFYEKIKDNAFKLINDEYSLSSLRYKLKNVMK
ncbi:glycosyltransferase [Clostridium sp. YIM B02505]|uniref:Glycosyltransferase n=1 Tax=Clostridium yunnanense TaxID=2800325 RepID=A0ABS1EWY8_9CLOT|nr:glycosyltransferase [Clostridium yunnanense]MBK1813887.1 glycosyltransferase [Clostridium yunnanense]